jgi:hypothetical protein
MGIERISIKKLIMQARSSEKQWESSGAVE